MEMPLIPGYPNLLQSLLEEKASLTSRKFNLEGILHQLEKLAGEESRTPEDITAIKSAAEALHFVDGRVLKRQGRLTALEPERIVSESSAAARALRARTGWR
ncbi:hypothetical protein D187_010313 [Cystobacter fuscus DSM 2262]|uniref:Uncharacterized protein n=1 Tax=Cystobacter fuscus (strain ATCC 25194 / DSM 2262 / NBRC 100088 / M29) TaxID=1242864 RepID=S9QKA7_CYSF2|nr:hypothetical protein [Cystobacter fuscus]EPX61694.1 hypothetical protein D187_010313 [Cystobacter fuscus DSM 2262]